MTGKTRVWPVKSTIRPDIVHWPAVILSPGLEGYSKVFHLKALHITSNVSFAFNLLHYDTGCMHHTGKKTRKKKEKRKKTCNRGIQTRTLRAKKQCFSPLVYLDYLRHKLLEFKWRLTVFKNDFSGFRAELNPTKNHWYSFRLGPSKAVWGIYELLITRLLTEPEQYDSLSPIL